MTDTSPMKVLLVGDFPPPHGGVAVHVEVLFRAIRAAGGTCEVLDIGKGQLPADGVVPAGHVARFTTLLGSYAARGFRIHVHTSGANPRSWMLAGICAAAGAVSGKAPLITFHSGLCPAWIAESPVRQHVARAVASRFGHVIAVSDGIRDCMLACGVAADRVEVMPAFSSSFLEPGAPPQGFAAVRAGAQPLFVAMLAPGKVYGHEILLNAFERVRAQVPTARLALYGLGSESVKAEGVTGFGELHRPAALAVIAGGDVFVRPTLADGDSVSVREALALGRLVVATRVGNRPPEVRLVAAGDAQALALGLLEAAAEIVARPVRGAPAAPAADSTHRLLTLYGQRAEASPAPTRASAAPEARCAASAAS